MKNRIVVLYVLVMAFCCCISGVSHAGQDSGQVVFSEGKLTIHADNIQLRALLEKIKHETGMEFRINQMDASDPISVSLETETFEKSLEIILRGYSYVYYVGPGSKKKLIVSGKAGDWALPEKRGQQGKSLLGNSRELPADKKGMEIKASSGAMRIDPPSGEGMEISHSSEPMKITEPDNEGMIILPPSGADGQIP